MLLPVEIIKKKRAGFSLSAEEIKAFVAGYTSGQIPDYQMSAFLMAICFQGMTSVETVELTKTMLHSGSIINFSAIPQFKVDKHSTGGVGDKTSLLLAPIVAACGVAVPMISGRGLGHTGGTLDKLESIPGFNTQLNLEEFSDVVEKHLLCFIGQTAEICPADKKIYALRDVTGTVESLPLICSSIMSKKLAEGIDGLVLDVKFGSGAFMKTPEDAEALALGLMSIAKGYGKKVTTLLTDMSQPLGQYAGNSLEVSEIMSILQNEKLTAFAEETKSLSISLAAHMLLLAEIAPSIEECQKLASQSLASGRALEKFLDVVNAQGGDIKRLPTPRFKIPVLATSSGTVEKMDCEKIGFIGVKIKAGRSRSDQEIEPTAGFEFHKKIGQHVEAGEPLITLFGANENLLNSVIEELRDCISLNPLNIKLEKNPLILKVLK